MGRPVLLQVLLPGGAQFRYPLAEILAEICCEDQLGFVGLRDFTHGNTLDRCDEIMLCYESMSLLSFISNEFCWENRET